MFMCNTCYVCNMLYEQQLLYTLSHSRTLHILVLWKKVIKQAGRSPAQVLFGKFKKTHKTFLAPTNE